jgi:hypothetical protein
MTPALDFSSFGGPAVSMEVRGAKDAARRIEEIGERAEDMRPAMRLIKVILEEGHARQFATKGSFLGTPWPENSPETVARKARSGAPSLASQMVESGDLQESLSGGKGGRSRVSKGGVSVGTSLFYALFHLNPQRDGMPARPVVGVNREQEETALSLIERHVIRGV